MVETGGAGSEGGGSVPRVDVTDENLESRLARLENVIEGDPLTSEAKELQEHLNQRHESLIEDQKQRRAMRKHVLWVAGVVIVFMMGLIVADIYLATYGTQGQVGGSVRIALFVSPIVSITTITIFLLVGAFRGFREKDMKNLPVSAIVSEAGRVISGR